MNDELQRVLSLAGRYNVIPVMREALRRYRDADPSVSALRRGTPSISAESVGRSSVGPLFVPSGWIHS